MIPKSMPSGFDPMGGNRFFEKIMLQRNIQTVIRFDLIRSRSRREPGTPKRAQIERREETAPRAFDIAPARITMHAWVIICNR
jgi:hypothetical protein